MLMIFKSRQWAQSALLVSGCVALAACGSEAQGTSDPSQARTDEPATPFVPEDVVATPLAGDSLWTNQMEQDRVLAAPSTPADLNDPIAREVAETVLGLNAPQAKSGGGSENVSEATAELTTGGNFNDCSFQYASAAYMAPDKRPKEICGNTGVPDASTEYLYVMQSLGTLVLAFRGTASFNDVLKDLQSENKVWHVNALSGTATKGSVGRGWTARWKEQVAANGGRLKSILQQMINLDGSDQSVHGGSSGPQQFDLLVVGHSLGAVTAQLAAYDIYYFFNTKFGDFTIDVTAFNPPKFGDLTMTQMYQNALVGDSARFKTATFSRSGDVVHNVPKGVPGLSGAFYHPTWNTVAGSKMMGELSNVNLPYCPQYNKPGFRLPLEAHGLGAWGEDIKKIPPSANCLFGSH